MGYTTEKNIRSFCQLIHVITFRKGYVIVTLKTLFKRFMLVLVL